MNNISFVLDAFFMSYAPSLSGNLRENRIERMKLLLEGIGNPEKSFKTIHIAGSKGKGTVAAALSHLLSSSGFKTGLYLSPHVYDIRERFTLSSLFFKDKEYLHALNLLRDKIKDFSFPRSLGESRPTTFELYTAYSYLLFKECGCEWAVIETGLGGRLDATNTLLPVSSVITAIEKEHTQILGDTISLIAGEKGGIIKENIPSFLLKGEKDAVDTIKRIAEEKNSPLCVFDPEKIKIEKDYDINTIEYRGIKLRIWTYSGDIKLLDIEYAVYILTTLGLLNKDITYDFLSPSFKLPGRFERRTVDGRLLIMDGAHTPSSVSLLASAVEKMKNERMTLIFSAAIDKNWVKMGEILLPLFESVVVSSTGMWKKSSPVRIYDDFVKSTPGKKITLLPDAEDALFYALNNTPRGGTIVVTGSFYLLSEIDKAIKEKERGN